MIPSAQETLTFFTTEPRAEQKCFLQSLLDDGAGFSRKI